MCGLGMLFAFGAGVAHAGYGFAVQWPVPEAARGLAVGPGGVYVARASGAFDEQAVRRYSPDGELVTTWGQAGSAAGALVDPSRLAVDPSGRVHVVDGFGKVRTYEAGGALVAERVLTAPCGDELLIRDIAVDAAGEIYVAFYDNCALAQGKSRYGVIRAGADFTVKAVWGATGAEDGMFNQPSGIAPDGRGTVYVADSTNYRIQKFSAAGAFAGKWGQLGGRPGQFNGLADVAVSLSGEVFVADRNNERVQRFAADGTFLEALQIPAGVKYRGLVSELAFDAQGRLYVLSTGHGTEDEVNVFVPASATVPKQTLRYRAGRISVKASCGRAARCSGTVELRMGKRKLGTRSYSVAAGSGKRVRVSVKRTAKRSLVRGRAHRVVVILKSGRSSQSKRTLTLRT